MSATVKSLPSGVAEQWMIISVITRLDRFHLDGISFAIVAGPTTPSAFRPFAD
jgi:hypothetical protein